MPPRKPPRISDEGIPFPLIPRARRYRVLSGGISTPAGPVWEGTIVTAERLGTAERVARLLARESIEEVTDAAD